MSGGNRNDIQPLSIVGVTPTILRVVHQPPDPENGEVWKATLGFATI